MPILIKKQNFLGLFFLLIVLITEKIKKSLKLEFIMAKNSFKKYVIKQFLTYN